ncbi:MAG: nucleotidyltransferase substrate binding protein [Epsilonproteobacteria bacterium]|nr:nucleotidyltransferase substrate binding protein [Campylobacterota bacterium]
MEKLILGHLDISPLLKTSNFFEQAIDQAQTDLEKAGAIQAFEFCYELAWKTMKRILSHRGIEATNPREVFRLAARDGLIADAEAWFEFIRKRNLTVHTYNEDLAEEIFDFLPAFNKELQTFIQTIKKL